MRLLRGTDSCLLSLFSHLLQLAHGNHTNSPMVARHTVVCWWLSHPKVGAQAKARTRHQGHDAATCRNRRAYCMSTGAVCRSWRCRRSRVWRRGEKGAEGGTKEGGRRDGDSVSRARCWGLSGKASDRPSDLRGSM